MSPSPTMGLALPGSDQTTMEFRSFTQDLARGKDSAWREFFELYHRRLRAYLSACWRGEPDLIDDLLQEALVRAVKHMRPFDDEEVLWSWLTVLARSVANDQGRKRSRFRAFLDRYKNQATPEHTGAPDQRLDLALTKLAPDDRDLVRRKYEDGASVREIAAELETSEKAVESRLTRCRKRLQKHLNRLQS